MSKRTATTSEWRNADGSIMIKQFMAPHFYKFGKSWLPISDTLTTAPGVPSVWQSRANNFHTSFGVTGRHGGMEQVATGASTIGLSPIGAASTSLKPTISGAVASYKNVWPNADLTESVGNTSIQEDLYLDNANASNSYGFALTGGTARPNSSGGLDVFQHGRVVGTIPAPVVTTGTGRAQADATKASGASLSYAHGVVTLAVSARWLSSLPASAFPVDIDPTYQPFVYNGWTTATNLISYASGGDAPASNVARFGLYSGDYWDVEMKMALPAPPAAQNNQPWKLGYVWAGMGCSSSCTLTNAKAGVSPNQVTSYSSVAANAGVTTGAMVPTGPDSINTYGGISLYLGNSATYAAGSAPWVSVTATASARTDIPAGDVGFEYIYYELPPPGTVTSLSNGAVISTVTPTLTTTVTDAQACTSDASTSQTCDSPSNLYYDFVVSTAQPGQGGQIVADSGWIQGPYTDGSNGVITYQNPTWTVPAGSLVDGATYYTWVESTNDEPTLYPSEAVQGHIYITPPQGTPTQFQVKERLNAGGPSPTDQIGSPPGQTTTPAQGAPNPGTSPSSETVDMVTGNLALNVTTPSMQTLAGPASVMLNYNSLKSSTLTAGGTGTSNYGLTAQYYADSGTHTYPTTAPLTQRVEPGVNLTDAYQPTAALQVDSPWEARWTGQMTFLGSGVPAGTTFQIGGLTTGGMRVIVGGTTVYDNWNGTNTASGKAGFASTKYTAGTSVQIEVDDWDKGTGTPKAQLMVQENFPSGSNPATAQVVVPANWLTAQSTGLPPGWTTLAAAPLWSSVSDLGNEVVVHAITGATATFTNTGNGTYQPPAGDVDSLSNNNGQLELSTSNGYQYAFNSDGSLASVTTAANDLKPAAMTYGYAQVSPGTLGSPIVLESITNPVSQQSITLTYSGEVLNGTTQTCPTVAGGAPAPTGMLCQVTLPDGSTTNLYYNTNGQLAEVLNPGSSATLFSYDSGNRLNDIRDALANDWIAAGEAGSNLCGTGSTTCPFDTQVTYDSSGRVSNISQPEPSNGASHPSRTYTYNTNSSGGTTYVKIAGFNPAGNSSIPAGDASSETFDNQSRVTAQTDSAGLTNHIVWNNTDWPIISLSADGEQTSTVYDGQGHATDVYGPAPPACFTAGTSNPWPTNTSYTSPPAPIQGYLPVASPTTTTGCMTTVPHTQSAYDQGITGLAAAFWPNAQSNGAPTRHGTGSGIASQASFACAGGTGTSATALCGSWPSGTTPDGGSETGWGMKLTGTINIAAAGTYNFTGTDTQPLTLFIDGTVVGTNVHYSSTGTISSVDGSFSKTTTLTTGMHTIEVDLQGSSGSTTSYTIGDYIVGQGTQSATAILLSQLDPNYGLQTSATDADGKTTTTNYTDGGTDAAYGLKTSQTVGDGSSTPLTTSYSYESPGSGWLRKTSTTLPAGNQTTYQYYGGQRNLSTTTCGVGTNVPQGGQLQTEIDPAPSSGAPAREKQFVYDALGREVGFRIGTTTSISSAGWACTTYDARGRIITEAWPTFNGAAARTVTYTYSWNGDPLAAQVSDTQDPNQAVTTIVDLLGRVVIYIDAVGDWTDTYYNQAGQITETNGAQGAVTNGYDPNTGNLTTVTAAGQVLATASYDATTGRMSTIDYSNHTYGTVGYDANGRQTGLTFTTGKDRTSATLLTGDQITDSPAGRITTELTNVAGTLTNPNPAGTSSMDYTYDGAGRLVTAFMPGQSANYGYANNASSDNCASPGMGANTNRTSVTVTPTGGSASSNDYCYNSFDQMTSTISKAGTPNAATNSNYVYDDHGNQTQDGATALTYDAADRLKSTTNGAGVTTSYGYDALNRVIARVTGNAWTFYMYAGFSDAPSLVRNPSGVTTQIVSLPGGVTDSIQTVGSYKPLTSTAILNTQTGLGTGKAVQVASNGELTLQVTGQGGVPSSGVSAVVLNLTAKASTTGGNIVTYADGAARPATSSLSYSTGQTVANLVVVPVGADGAIDLYNQSNGSTDLLGDVEGYYTAGTSLNSGAFVPLTSTRLLDTTSGTGGTTGPVAANSTTSVQVSGQGGVPTSNVLAVVVNLTETNPTAAGSLTVYADGGTVPTTANVNFAAGQSMANEAIIPLGSDGKLDILNNSSGTTQLQLDVVGYYKSSGSSSTNSGDYVPLNSTQILNTTTGTGGTTGPVAAGATTTLQVTGAGGIPTSCVSAVELTVTAKSGTASGSLTAYQDGTSRPATSNLDWAIGQTVDNQVIVPVGSNGKVDLYNNSTGTMQLLGDVSGYFTCSSGATGDIWSYPDLHGNITATTDDNGALLGNVMQYDPWGQPLANPVDSTNAPVTSNFSSYGGDGKISDTSSGITIMGARAYNASDQRFTSVDPIFGGCANAYTYSFGDPLNHPDLTGQGGCRGNNDSYAGCSLIDLSCTVILNPGVVSSLANTFANPATQGGVGGAGTAVGVAVCSPLNAVPLLGTTADYWCGIGFGALSAAAVAAIGQGLSEAASKHEALVVGVGLESDNPLIFSYVPVTHCK